MHSHHAIIHLPPIAVPLPPDAHGNHIHMLLSIPPKYSVAMTMGFLKGKSAIRINRDLMKQKGSLRGRAFWARGYCVSTVGLNEVQIREYVRNQEKHDRQQDGQLELDI